jgi:hypothetical protein
VVEMDPFLSGLCQRYIDAQLEEAEIQNIKGVMDLFGFAIKSKLDAELGFFVGYSYSQLLMQFFILNNRLPNKDEITEYYKLMKRRFPEVISQIKKTKTSKLKEFDEELTTLMEIPAEPNQQTLE